MPYGQVDRICKLVPNNPANPVTLQEAIDSEPLLRSMQDDDETVKKLIEISLQLEGLYRHASTHAAGVVIADRDITELVPLYSDQKSDIPATQFNMKFVEKAGLVKFDFLGLKTLTVLSYTISLLEEQGVNVDLTKIPLDDKSTFEMIAQGETMGVFQFESAGMRDLLIKSKAECFEDLIAAIALYRPGPMDNIPKYLACKLGHERPDYLDPSIKSILEETHGIMIYQEQVMQIAQTLAGYSLGGADLLRRAMGKKIKSEMEAQRKIFVEGAMKNGLTKAKASSIFDQVNKFAGYGFNKSHAAAYALISYQTAYMKANYPVAFLAASMQLDIQNTDKLNIFAEELKRLKIPLFKPDINISDVHFSIEQSDKKFGIRYALPAIKGVGTQAMESVVEEREKNGDFLSVAQFLSRIDARMVNKRQLEALICAGAFDSICERRHALFAAVENLVQYAQSASLNAKKNQIGLFDSVQDKDKKDETALLLGNEKEWPSSEKLQKEFDVIGFYLDGHPLDSYNEELNSLGVFESHDKSQLLAREYVKLAGMTISMKEKKSSKGNKFAFLRLSCSKATYEITIFSEVLAGARDVVSSGQPVVVEADVVPGENDVRLIAQSIYPLEKAMSNVTDEIRIPIRHELEVEKISPILLNAPEGKMKVIFDLQAKGDNNVDCDVEIEFPRKIFLMKNDKEELLKMISK